MNIEEHVIHTITVTLSGDDMVALTAGALAKKFSLDDIRPNYDGAEVDFQIVIELEKGRE